MTTVVLMHAFGGSARSWDLVRPLLVAPLVVPNLRGFGGTEAPVGDYSVDSYVRDVLAIVEGLEDYVLVGHSMSGKFAMATAALRPKGLRGLLLVAPSPPTPEPMTEEDRQATIEGWGKAAYARKTVEKITKRPLSDDLRRETEAGYLLTAKRAWDAWMEIGSRENIADRMAEIKVPVRLIAGEADPILGPKVQRPQTVSRIAGCEIETVPDAGHLLPIEVPERVAEAIRNVLATENAGTIRG